MTMASLNEYEYHNRFNVSVPNGCYDAVNDTVAKACLFNGRSDFVFSAIRYLSILCNLKFNEMMEEAKKSGDSPLEVYFIFKQKTQQYGTELLTDLSAEYPGTFIRQIPIRPDDSFYKMMVNLSSFLFNDGEESIRVQKLCRGAIGLYLKEITEESKEHYALEQEFNALKKAVITSKPDFKLD